MVAATRPAIPGSPARQIIAIYPTSLPSRLAEALHRAGIMTPIDLELLAHTRGGAGPLPKTAGEMFPNEPVPHAEWTTWGSKTAGHPAPPLGDPSGIRYTFWGRPARNAIVVSGPRF